MRILSKLVAGAAVLATVTMISAGPALADPPKGVVPKDTDIVGVGSNTTEYVLDQLGVDYNATVSSSSPHLYSFDATNPYNGDIGDNIITKVNCKPTPRPDGSSAGITALDTNLKASGDYCIDFARSSRPRGSSDPPKGKGGIEFVEFATDAVSYASAKTTNAPKNLTTADLTAIYSCTDTKWNQVGGTSSATIAPYLPQPGSGTLSFFLAAIGVTTPGPCVTQPSTLEENEGVDPVFTSSDAANIIIPFSIGKWIAQAYHSAKCLNSKCVPDKDVICNAGTGGTNEFGCDLNGVLGVDSINGTAPTTGSGKSTAINPSFTADFQRGLYNVVRYDTATPDHMAPNLEPIFASRSSAVKGYLCSDPGNVIQDYGYRTTPLCGLTS
ncbi:MAG: substrate-binding domain-containing protein [Streptosporangiaceae bacterium]|jgi:ABC-type phosphate transport system substrate-binding protein